MECRHSVSKSNDIDIDPNYDNPVFVSFQTHVRNLKYCFRDPLTTQTNRDPHGTNLVSATCDLSLFVLFEVL